MKRDSAQAAVEDVPYNVIVAAWIIDRAEQYDNSSAMRAAFDELVRGVLDGEPMAAYRHGELDDINIIKRHGAGRGTR